MVTGGSEAALTPMGLAGFQNMRALSCRTDAPQQASRPFDKDRDGFVLAEGKGGLSPSGEPTQYRDSGDRLPLQEQVSHMSLNRH